MKEKEYNKKIKVFKQLIEEKKWALKSLEKSYNLIDYLFYYNPSEFRQTLFSLQKIINSCKEEIDELENLLILEVKK